MVELRRAGVVVSPVWEGLVLPAGADVLVLGKDKGGLIKRFCGAVVNLSITILSVVGSGVVGQNLDVLIAVVHLALLEVDGSVHLVIIVTSGKVSAQGAATIIKTVGADSTKRIVVIVVTVINHLLGAVGATVGHV